MPVQYHRPHPGELLTTLDGRTWPIETVHYESGREVFRVSWLDPDSTSGRRGCQVTRGDGNDWYEVER